MKCIGTYLTRSKRTAENICEYLYCKKGSDKSVPKRQREFEPADILELLKFFRVVEGVGERAVCEPAARTVLATIGHIGQHYTYTLCPEYASTNVDIVEDDTEDNENENDDDSSQVVDEIGDEPVSMFDIL